MSKVSTARTPSQLNHLVEKYGSDKILPLALDLTNKEQVLDAIKTGHAKFGRVDIVVNNAGYANTASIEDISVPDFRPQVDANLFGGYGHIFQISSAAVLEAAPFGIKVTVLEPGGIGTDWAGSSMHAPPVSEPYRATVGGFAEFPQQAPATALSLPGKIADLILKLLDEKEPPLRMLVGRMRWNTVGRR
ncbi:hypothetical protein BJX99DRAFT_255643 [Aspergillus californicus]